MKKLLISIKDNETETYHQPKLYTSELEAIKYLKDVLEKTKDTELEELFLKDLEVWKIGTFDENTGTIENDKEFIMEAIELKKKGLK